MNSDQISPQPVASALASVIERIKTAPPTMTETQIAEREQHERESARNKAIHALVSEAGGERYANFRFLNWHAKTEKQAAVKQIVSEWAETFPERLRDRQGLVLWGPVGTGKDHLVFAAVRQAVIQHGASVRWRNGRDLMGEIRDRISEDRTEREWISTLESPQVLVISDPLPVVGPLSPHQADMLYRVVDNRYAAGKLTLVTLNAATDDECDSRLGVATWDRLCGEAWKVKCEWASHRRPAREIK